MLRDIKVIWLHKSILSILLLASFIRLIVYFFILPSSYSPLGPDESTYAALALYVSKGLPVQDFPSYGAGLYNSAKTVALSSALLIKLGLQELSAVRVMASIYGLASSLLIVLCYFSYLQLRNYPIQDRDFVFNRKNLILLSLFTFFPSNFLWSTIGLRESASQFWLITTFYFILRLSNLEINTSPHASLILVLGLALSLSLAFGSRPETALVFGLVFLVFCLTLAIVYRKLLPLIAISIGLLAGLTFTTTPEVKKEKSFRAILINVNEISSSPTPKPVEGEESPTPKPVEESKYNISAAQLCTEEGDSVTFKRNRYKCTEVADYKIVDRDTFATVEGYVEATQSFEYKRNQNALNAQSALPVSNCQNLSREIAVLVKCNLTELPFRLLAFLFRPLLFIEQGSTILTFAAIENLAWIVLVPLSIWVSMHNKANNLNRFINWSLISYVLIFASGAALYEGNLGTAFRHKSSILWPIIFLLMIAPKILPKSRRETTSVS